MARLRYLLLCFLGLVSFASAQVITPFTIRHQATQKGGIRFVSNVSTTCAGAAGGCPGVLSQIPPAGTGMDNTTNGAYIDIDADGTTFQSSSDSLNLPTCSEITWAGLYWGGEMTAAGTNFAVRNQCRVKVNAGAYQNITASSLQDNTVGFNTYHCFADITALVQAAGIKSRFTVANVATRMNPLGTQRFGGWTIVVVYKNDLQPMRNLTVFNGLSNVSGAFPITDITVNGFLTPLAGPVTFELGQVTYDGDRSSTGDQLQFNGAGPFVNVLDAVNPTNDVFNSTLSYGGVNKTAPFINPNFQNTLGYDADIYIPNNAAKNYIGNSATTATLRLTTGGETYLTQVVSMAIDVYEPDLRAAVKVQDLNGGAVEPGDILEYTVLGKNIGSDPSNNTYITDTLEFNATFVPGSIEVLVGPNVGVKTDAIGDDQGEYEVANRVVKVRIGTGANGVTGGTVLNSPQGIDSTIFRFRVQATTDCVFLACDNIVDNKAFITGTGNVSSNVFTNGSNPGIFDINGCPIPGTTATPINAALCTPLNDTTIASFCSGYSFASVLPYPPTYTYYNSAFVPTPSPVVAGVYYAILPAYPGCGDTIVITLSSVIAGPTTAAAGPDQTGVATCGLTSVTLAGNVAAVGTGTWTIIAGAGGTVVTPNSPTSAFNGVAGNTYTLRWTVGNACASTFDDVVITFNQNPSLAAAGADQTGVATCGTTSTALAANVPGIGTGTWTIIAGAGGTVVTPASASSVFNGVAGTTYTLRWTITNPPCPASTDDVIVTFNQNPTVAAAGPDQTNAATCGTTSATLAANAPLVGTGTWTIVAGAGGTVVTPGSPTSVFNGVAGTAYTLRWTITNAPCPASFDDVDITFNLNPTVAAAGADQTGIATCGLTSTTLAGNTPLVGSGTWSIVSGAGGTIGTPANPTSAFSGVAGTTYTLRWTITNPPCAASFDDVVIIFNQNPTVAAAGADQTGAATCGSTSTTLTGNAPAVGTGAWTIIAGAGGSVVTPTSPTSVFNGVAGNTYTLRWTITNAPCPASFDDVIVTFNLNSSTANAGPDQTGAATCGTTSTTLAGNAPAVGTGTWTIIAGAGGSVVTPTSPTSVFNGVAGTAYTLRWTVVNAPCPATFDDVDITFNLNPTVAAAGADQTGAATCGTTSTVLTGNAPAVGTGTWTIIAGAGGTVVTPGSATSVFNGVAGTTYTLRWTITNAPCPASFDDVDITFNLNPTVANAGADQTSAVTCGGTSTTLAGNAPAVGTGVWTIIAGAGGSVVTPGSPTSVFNGVAGTTYTLRWTITNAPCPASFDDVVVTFNLNPTVAAAGADQTGAITCGLTSTTLAGNTPAVGTGTWTIIAGGGGTVVTPGSPTSTFNGVAGVPYTLRWTVTNPPCPASFDDVNVTFNLNPSAALAGPDQGFACQDTAIMAATAPAVGTGTWTVVTGTATIDNANSPTTTIRGLTGGPVTMRWTVSNPPCTSTFDDVIITRNNCPPILDNEFHVIAENTFASGDLTDVGDSDPDGTVLTANTVPVVAPSNGGIVINTNGTYTYTPNPGFNGTDMVVVQICDAGNPLPAICLNDTIFITVNPVNDPPVVDNEFHVIPEDNPATGDLTDAGDLDPDGTPLTANTIPVSGPTNGSIVILPNGTYTYTPNPNFNGTDMVVVQICDAGIPLPAACVNDTIFITVTPVNDPPVVDNEFLTTPEDTPISGDLTDAGDSDPDGTPLTANTVPVSGPTNGSIVINPNGTYTYTPNPNYNGPDQVVVQICDAGIPLPALCVNDTIFITVTPVNDPPIVDNEFLTTPEDTPVSGDLTDAGDSDPDGTPLTANTVPVSGPTNGSIVILPNGTYTYTPNPNFNGTDVVVVQICDAGIPLPALCVNDTIFITVTPVNDPPIVDNEFLTTPEDTPISGDLTDVGDSDPDGTPLTANTVPVSGPTNGSIVINPNGTYTYTPNPNYNGTDQVVVQICDAGIPLPALCVNDTIFITVTPVNDPPIVDNEFLTTPEDTPVSGDLTDAGDSDPDGTPLTANTVPVSGPTNGSIVILPNGTYTYTPNPNFNGTDVVVVQICDAGIPLPAACVNDTIFITVTPVNDPPIVDNEFHVINEDNPASGDLTDVGDSDPDGTVLTASTLPVSGPTNGSIVINPNGTYTYTPNPNYNGTDQVVVQICDAGTPLPAQCVNDTIFITILPVNDPPVGTPDTIIIPEDTTVVTICASNNDTDVEGDPLTITTSCGPSNGTASVVANCINYIPNPNFNGNDTICYIVCDPFGGCDTTIVVITVTPVNDPPIGNPDTLVIPEDTSTVTICVTTNDTDIEGDPLTVTMSCAPLNGTASLAGNCFLYTPNPNFNGNDTICYIVCDPFGGCDTTIVVIVVTPVNDPPIGTPDTLIIPEDTSGVVICVTNNDTDVEGDPLTVTPSCGPTNGTISMAGNCIVYTPDPNFNGNDTICYIVCDPFGGCDTTIVVITVTPVNDPPIGNPDTLVIPEDTSGVVICVTTNDTDIEGDPLTITPNCGPNNGTIALAGNCIIYTPALDFNGNDTICYIVCDPFGGCDTTIVVITVTPVNDPPNGNPDTLTIPEDTTGVIICVTNNDSDVENDPLTVTMNCGPNNGTATMAGNCIVYTPDPNFNGNDTICYILCDPFGACDTTIVVITVTPVNDPPIGVPDTLVIPEDTSGVIICVTTNDSDIDGDPLTITPSCGPSNGTITVAGNCITYTPNPNFNGNDTICYILCDPFGECDTTIVVITVTPINDPPVGNPDYATIPEDTSGVTICVTTNDTDAEGDPLTIAISCQPTNGTITVVGNCITYVPDPNFNGNDTICYIVCDPFGGCDTTIVVITVTPVNDPPIAVDDYTSVPSGGSVVIPVQGNDSDLDGDPLTTTIIVPPSNGTAVVLNGDSIVYTPNPGFFGNDTLYYVICDDGIPPLCDTAMVVITVVNTAFNNPPDAVDDYASTPMNTILFVPVLVNDSDPDGNNLVGLTILSPPSRGYAVVGGDSIIYVPNTGYIGQDTLTYYIWDDGLPQLSDTATVYINVFPTNNPPVAANDSIVVQSGTTGVIPVLGNDYDPDSTFLDVTLCEQPDNGTAVINANGSISYTPFTDFTGMDTLCYIICDQGTPVLCDTAYVFITVEPNVGIFIPNTFTPNGDGDNDLFVVLGLENYPDATLDVFNRWGNIVFSGDPYHNEWDGNSNAGNPLPVGTYYYVLDLKDGNPGLTGFVMLHR